MGDPVLALKWFCLFLVLLFILSFLYKAARNYRLMYGKVKLFASKTETFFLILSGIDAMIALGCIIWCVIAWIAS